MFEVQAAYRSGLLDLPHTLADSRALVRL